MVAIDLFLLSFAIVNIIDLSGFVEDGIQPFFKRRFGHYLKTKPFLCSYCLTHHIGVLYLLFTGSLTLATYCLLLLVCWLTPVIKDVTIIAKEAILKALDKIAAYLNI